MYINDSQKKERCMYIYPILDILAVVFFHTLSVRSSMTFHSCYLLRVHISRQYRINQLLKSFRVRYCETFHSLTAGQIPRVLSIIYTHNVIMNFFN